MTSKKISKKSTAHEWRYASLTICGKHLDPEKVTQMLGINPNTRGKLGEPCGPNNKYKTKQGFWVLYGGPSNWCLETQLKYIFKRITPVKKHFKQMIKENKDIKDVYLTIAVQPNDSVAVAGYYINSEILNKFTSLGIGLALSIYVPAEFSAERLSNIVEKLEDN